MSSDDARVRRRRRPRLPFAAVRRRLAPFSPRSGKIVALLVAFTIVGGLAEAAALVLVARTALAITAGEEVAALGGSLELSTSAGLWIALGALAVKLSLSVAASWIGARLSARTVRFGRHVLLDAFFRADWPTQSKERLGELQDYLTTAVGRLNSVNQAFVNGLNALVSFSVIILAAIVINPLAAIGCAMAAAALLLFLRPLTRLTRRYTHLQNEATRELAARITESVRLSQEVRVFGVRRSVLRRLDQAEARASGPLEQANFTMAVTPSIYQTLALAFLVLGVAAADVVGRAEIASLGAAVVLLLRGLSYGQQLQTAIQNLASTLPYLDSLHERKRLYDLHADRPGHVPISGVGELELRDVTFAYREGEPVLNGISLSITRCESIGVVGPSGSGKSTLLQLLLRLRVPTSGAIFVDELDLWHVRDEAWADRVAFVPQDPRLMDATVAENVSFFRDLEYEDIERAARLAHIHDEIMSWPDGYGTKVGESGNRISGGQRQRITIARALAAHPDLLILDEPTSALDLLSEARLQQTLAGLKGKIGLVIVAHRLSTVARCDRILVLRDGHSEGFDTHQRLLEMSAFYREAVKLSMIEPAEEPGAVIS